MSDFVVECKSVKKSFDYNTVLDEIDIQISRGSVVGLLGKNGCGKSTLLKCLTGLLRIDSGSALVLGENPWNLSERAKANIGYVPQKIELYPWMSVMQITRYFAAFYPNWDQSFCSRLTDEWELPKLQRVEKLSGGQLQRLALVLAMSHHPALLILDEPVSAIDPAGRRQFLRSLLELTETGDQTVLYSTHITSDLERVSTHAGIIDQGRMSVFGELEELKDRGKGNLETIFVEMHDE